MNHANASRIPVEKNFVPWATDASELLRGRHGDVRNREWIRDLHLIESNGLKEYERGTPVVASWRGNGKSTLVTRRAVRLLLDGNGADVTLRPHAPFINELVAKSIELSDEQLGNGLTSSERWYFIWRCTLIVHLACMILRYRNIKGVNSEEISAILYKECSLENALDGNQKLSLHSFILSVWEGAKGHRESIAGSLSRLIDSGLSNVILSSWSKLISTVADDVSPERTFSIHIDAIDEAFGTINGGRLLDDEGKSHDETPGREHLRHIRSLAWIAAQKGFLAAAHVIPREISVARIYGSIRIEASLNLNDSDYTLMGTTRQKFDGSTLTKLSYSPSELQKIYELNVDATDYEDLACPSESDRSSRLFGFTEVKHSTVYGVIESVFQLFYRHTFGTARDLVAIAKSAKGCAVANQRKIDTERFFKAIDHAATCAFSDWSAAVVPVFHNEIRAASLKITRNWFNSSEISKIEESCGYPGLIDKLYSRGMVGIPERSVKDNGFTFSFRTPDGKEEFISKEVDYAVLHPALSSWICSNSVTQDKRVGFYSSEFVVGQGVKCPPKISKKNITLNLLNPNEFSISSNKSPIKTVDVFDKFTFCPDETDVQRKIARELFCALMLTKKRLNSDSITEKNLIDEELFLKDVGLLKEKWGVFSYSSYIQSHIFGNSKSDLLKKINSSLVMLDVAIKMSDLNAKNTNRTLNIMWRNGNQNHQKWTSVKAEELEILVLQNRSVA
jgi:hypothetical protein